MSSFTRYAAVAAVVLSLGFLVTALPALRLDISFPTVAGEDPCSKLIGKLAVDLALVLKVLADCKTLVDVQLNVQACIALLQACADELVKIGAGVAVTVEAKASIVLCVAAILSTIVQVLVRLTLQLGVQAMIAVCVPLDIALRALFVSLDVCVGGILVLIKEKILSADVSSMVQLGLNACVSLLGLGVAAL